MNKKLVLWFCLAFVLQCVWGMTGQSPDIVALSELPLLGLIVGVLSGVQVGLFIPLLAWLAAHFKSKDQNFVILFVAGCGVSLADGVLWGVWGLPLFGFLFMMSKIVLLCIIYRFTFRWWRKSNPS